MNYSKFEKLFSAVRLHKYLTASQATSAAVAMYEANIHLCQAMYGLIAVLEVALRNVLDDALKNHFEDENWLISHAQTLLDHPAMAYKDRQSGKLIQDRILFQKLNKTALKIRQDKHVVSHSKLLANLTFGFWIKFFDKNLLKILKGASLKAFSNSPHLPANEIYEHLNTIRMIRNRIAHHEPICFNKSGEICLRKTKEAYGYIYEVLSWIDEELAVWCKEIDYVPMVMKRIDKISRN